VLEARIDLDPEKRRAVPGMDLSLEDPGVYNDNEWRLFLDTAYPPASPG
jgi:hypothetical protein